MTDPDAKPVGGVAEQEPDPQSPAFQRLLEAVSKIDIKDDVLALVPAAIDLVNARRGVWQDNHAIDDDLNEALGAVTLVAGWAANGALESDELVCLRGEVAELQANAKSDLDLKLEVVRLQSERDAPKEIPGDPQRSIESMLYKLVPADALILVVQRVEEIVDIRTAGLRAEVTAAKADALEQAADEIRRKDSRWVEGEPLIDGPLSRWLRERAAGIRVAEPEGGQR